MARIAGIQFEKDSKGNPQFIRINLKKWGKEIKPFLINAGFIDYEKDWEEALTPKEFRKVANAMLKKKFDASKV
jgi:hypothetical protein